MKLRQCLTLILALSASLVNAQVNNDLTPSGANSVIKWNDVLLDSVRHAYMGPPMVARALAIAHTCMYDAWAAYSDRAVGSRYGATLRRPEMERTPENKNIAISYAAYRAAVDLFPKSKPKLDAFMMKLGYDPKASVRDPKTPIGIGNLACEAVLAVRADDGSNQSGERDPEGRTYWDYTDYAPVNEPVPPNGTFVRPTDPDRYQPLIYEPSVRAFYPPFLGAQWFKVASFAGPYDAEISRIKTRFPIAKYGSREYVRQAEELLKRSSALTDQQKMIAEYWSDGPHSELPPGHWCLFAQFISFRDHHTVDDDVKLFFALTNAVMDAGIASWTAKREVDSVRPITAIHLLFHGRKVQAWGGPGKGAIFIDGADWLPYQPAALPTPPFPEYPSGHSTFSAAAARILQLWTGSDRFDGQAICSAGSSRIEHGTPAHDVVLKWRTFTSAANQAGLSRRLGGIHFKAGDLAGRALGRDVAEKVWRKAQQDFGSKADVRPLTQ